MFAHAVEATRRLRLIVESVQTASSIELVVAICMLIIRNANDGTNRQKHEHWNTYKHECLTQIRMIMLMIKRTVITIILRRMIPILILTLIYE